MDRFLANENVPFRIVSRLRDRGIKFYGVVLSRSGCSYTLKGKNYFLSEDHPDIHNVALPMIPELKITDKGLVDVTRFEIVPLFGEG